MKIALILATGSNLGNRLHNLQLVKKYLSEKFKYIASSKIYLSKAVDYTKQPNFYNQVLEFSISSAITPQKVLSTTQKIESLWGWEKIVPKGPRYIDIDILFYGSTQYQSEALTIPHPHLFERSFVLNPLKELPYYKVLKTKWNFSNKLNNQAYPLNPSPH